jgi:hypothetical protein
MLVSLYRHWPLTSVTPSTVRKSITASGATSIGRRMLGVKRCDRNSQHRNRSEW